MLEIKTREFENYGSGSTERKKLCSACHLPGHMYKYVDRSVLDKDLLLRRKQVEISDNCDGNTWLVT